MAQNTRVVEQGDRSNLYFVEMRVYLFNPGTSPSLVNPDFLRHNEIVDPAWQLVRPVIMETDFSRIRYSNGVSLSAYENYVVVTQTAATEATDSETMIVTPLTRENILCFGVAERFFEMASPNRPYETLSIDPICMIEIPEATDQLVSSPFREIAERVRYEGNTPAVEARLSYELQEKEVILYVTEVMRKGSNDLFRLRLRGEIIRAVYGDTPEEQVNFIKGVFGNWTEDLQNFEDLAYGVYSLYIQGEN